jgi:glucokinase
VTSAIGVDVGGSKIAACVVDVETGHMLKSLRCATNADRGGEAVLADCVDMVDSLVGLGDVEGSTAPLGVAVCELVNPSGAITSAATFDWRAVDLAAAFGRPVVIESDVRAAAVGEARLGAGRGCANFVYITVGTGIAFTLTLGGRPYTGSHGNALILGSPPVEQLSSGAALARLAGVASAEEVFDRGGSEQLVREATHELGCAMAWLVNALDPELVIVGGGLGLRDDYREAAIEVMRSRIEAHNSRDVMVVLAQLGADAGAIGVALLASDGSR